jgi:hypothetical protein
VIPGVPHYESWDDVPSRSPTYRPRIGRPVLWLAGMLWVLALRINHLSDWLTDWVTIDRGDGPGVFTVPSEATARLIVEADKAIDDGGDDEPN